MGKNILQTSLMVYMNALSVDMTLQLLFKGTSVAEVARQVNISRPTVYDRLERARKQRQYLCSSKQCSTPIEAV